MQLSEYAIAIDIFARKADFDPKIDATVRLQVSRLRQKLRESYEREGKAIPQRVTIPTGGHRVAIHVLDADTPGNLAARSATMDRSGAARNWRTRTVVDCADALRSDLLGIIRGTPSRRCRTPAAVSGPSPGTTRIPGCPQIDESRA